METKTIAKRIIVSLAIAIIFNACKKENNEEINNNPKQQANQEAAMKSASDNMLAESVFGGIFKQADNAAKNSDNKDINTGCPSITINPFFSFPKTITIDYGTSCTCPDGKIRSGKIIAVLTGPYMDSLSTLTITPSNYNEISNGVTYTVQGTETITNLGRNSQGHRVFEINVANAVISSVNGTVSWNSYRQYEWIAGESTWFNIFDDVHLITGYASGVNSNGVTFSINITTPLRVEICCPNIVSGTFEIVTSALPTLTVDYGTGTCDNIATVTFNGYTFTIYI